MSKIRNEVIRNFIQTNPTSKEIDFLLYIARYQDADGVCRGIYYKDTMEAIGCCKQTFYSVMQSLQDKNIIQIQRDESKIDYDIIIIGNQGNYKDGYLNARMPALHTQGFKNLSAGAKMIGLDLLILIGANKTAWDIGKNKLRKRYGVEDIKEDDVECVMPFKIKLRTFLEYLKQLKKLFVFRKAKDKDDKPKICIVKRFLKGAERPEKTKTDNEVWTEHLVKVLCRRNKIKSGNRNISDVAELILQYKDDAIRQGKSMCRVLIDAFNNALERLQKNIIHPKLIHNYVRHELYGEPIKY